MERRTIISNKKGGDTMQKHNFWGYQVEIDEKATTDWYAQSSGWGCECGDCRNFLALAKRRAFLAPIVETLDSLGIPLEKATYVGELFKTKRVCIINSAIVLPARSLLPQSKRLCLTFPKGGAATIPTHTAHRTFRSLTLI